MSKTRTTCPYCGVGCGLIVTVCDDGVSISGDDDHPSNRGRLCSKGAALAETLDLEGRLLHPEIEGRRVDWATALDAVANGFSRVIADHGPDAVAFYVSGQLLTEDYYVANKLMKGFIGSANIDTNSRLCMASAVAGYKRAFGSDTVPNSYADLDEAELLVLVGSNMAWCHPVLHQRIVAAKAADAGKRIVVIDPRRTASCDQADLFLKIRPGTDVILFNGLLNFLRREDALDLEFLDNHAEGFGAAMRVAKASAPSIPAVASACGLAERDVAQFYQWFSKTPKTVTLFSQGVNQSSSGTDKVNSIINVHIATGRIGRPGAGPFSLTGQPNAMGGREVGGLSNQLAAHMDFEPDSVDRVARFWNARRVASKAGLRAVELFDAVADGRVKAVWIMSTNPVVSMPDAERVRAALAGCELVVVSDCVRETDTAACADILLPAATWGEKSGTVTSSERRIMRQRAFLPPPGECRPDWWIVSQVARRMGFGDQFAYRSPRDIFCEHARLSAFENGGRRDFDIGGLAELSERQYDEMRPTRWPHRAAVSELEREVFADGRFYHANGRVRCVATVPRAPPNVTDAEHPLLLNTGRIRDQWHTMTRTGKSARLSGHRPEPVVEVHPDDARVHGVGPGDLGVVASALGRVLARVQLTDDVFPGTVFVPMHWNDQFASLARVGTLIPAETDPLSGQPEFKSTPVSLKRFDAAWSGFVLSRRRLTFAECEYRVTARGQGHWRHELAGGRRPDDSWSSWVRRRVGDGDWIELSDAAAGRYRAALMAGGRLQACVFVAEGGVLPRREWLGTLFAATDLSESERIGVLAGRPGNGRPECGPVVCSCFDVGRRAIIDAIRIRRLATVDEIGEMLQAGTNCGSCRPELNTLIQQFNSDAAAVG